MRRRAAFSSRNVSGSSMTTAKAMPEKSAASLRPRLGSPDDC
jgi:hypothetical protein